MRDPMSWSVPLFRAFGIPVKVHIFFFLVTLGLFLRQVIYLPHVWWVDIFLFVVVALFGIILLHEFGHCFAARYMHGDANEVLLWPLGGLANCEVPHTPRANARTSVVITSWLTSVQLSPLSVERKTPPAPPTKSAPAKM